MSKKKTTHSKLKGRSQGQQSFINSLYEFNTIIVEGDAGTGKTFPPSVVAIDMLFNERYPYREIKLIRPNVELGESIGFVKGTLYEKMKPWIVPFEDGFKFRLRRDQIVDLIDREVIEPVPVSFLRGRTWSNCIVLVDEAQNLTRKEMKCLLRRIGRDCKLIICADLDQCDLKNKEDSAIHLLYDIDDLAMDRDIRRPYCWHTLTEGVRSDTCEWFGAMIREVEGE